MSLPSDEHKVVDDDTLEADWRAVVRGRDAAAFLALLGAGLAFRLPLPPSIEAVVLLAAVGVAAVSPLAAVTVGILALPFAYETVVLLRQRLSMLELAVVVAVVGISLTAANDLRRASGRQRLRRAVQPWWLPAAAIGLVAAGTLSLVVTGGEQLAENLRVFRWTIAEPVAFGAACAWTLQRDGERRFLALVFVAVGALTGLAAVAAAVVGVGGVAVGSVTRPQLFFPHPNNLAFFLERAAVVAIGLALAGRRTPWLRVGACLALGGVLVTFSRGAFLGVAVAVVWLLGRRRRQGWTPIAGAALATVAIGALWLAGRLFDPGGDGELPTRLAIWRSSARMLADHPVFGVGLDGFLYEYWRRYVEPIGWPERYTSHPHNLLLDVWLRLGILGFLAFAAVVGAFVVTVGQERRFRPELSPLTAASTAALLAGLGHGFVDNGYFLPDLAVMTWFLIALGAGGAAGDHPESR